MRRPIFLISFFILSFLTQTNSFAQISLDLETGVFNVNKNDASSSWKNSFGDLNGTEGTLFSYAKDFKNPPRPLLRVRANYTFGKKKKHVISLLAAPLQYRCEGTFKNTVIFNSTLFEANKSTQGFYKFSGYRFTYRYKFIQKENMNFALGLTLNLRDAEFSLRQGDKYERNFNRGFVPLINTYFDYKLYRNIRLLIDGDVFYIDNTGGAIDYLCGISFKTYHLSLKAGYRFFSGVGSEIGNVYNSLFVSSYVIGAVYDFK